jgi:cytoskeleton protein RodZ
MQFLSVMVESIGKKLVQARLARGLTLEEAAMETRIRARQLAALEADDYSSFANNTYARGFLLMYGKFLNVDVRAFARELEAGSPISLADYQYLNAVEATEEKPIRRASPETRGTERRRPSFAPLIAFVVLLAMVGFGLHLFYQAKRLDVGTSNSLATPAPDGSPVSDAKPEVPKAPAPSAVAPSSNLQPAQPISPSPAVVPLREPAVPTAAPAPIAPSTTVSDRQFLSTAVVPAAPPIASGPTSAINPPITGAMAAPVNELIVEPLKKTWVRIRRDDPAAEPIFEDVLYPKVGPLKLKGNRFWVEVRDADAVMLRKNGQPLAYQPPGIAIQ